MELKDFLARLHVESGPNASGEYMCRCPAHKDSTASLCVTEGVLDQGRSKGKWAIKIHCQAGCSGDEVMSALGLGLKDLYPDAQQANARRSAKPKPEQIGGLNVHTTAPAKPVKKDYGKLTKTYTYRDEQGKALFEVCRFEIAGDDGTKKKTFLQRVYDPTNRAAKTYAPHKGYVLSAKNVRHPLYMLPEVLQAIKDRKTVYLVEGEKDVETLAAQGLCATTNPGGASKSGQAIKWQEEHTESLRGAKVAIIPDNDETGLYDRQQVAIKLLDVCEGIKFLDLTNACQALPPKGDVSDMFEIMGVDEGLKALIQLEKDTEPYTVDASEIAYPRAINAINGVPGYVVKDGCICKIVSDGAEQRLCSFVAAPTAEITRDDGVTQETFMTIRGWTDNKYEMPEVKTSSKTFKSLSWVMDNWGFRGNIRPGNMVNENLRYVIGEAGRMHAKRYTEYTHTGWRKINGKWAFLYRGGAIGADGISVDLGKGLDRYTLDSMLDCGETISKEDGIMMSYQLTELIGKHVSIPLLAMIYLSPLKSAMESAGCEPGFSIFLAGLSGGGKSTAAALALSHFGDFTGKSLPTSFKASPSHLEQKAFLLKDMCLVVDDYHPSTSMQERRKMDAMAQSLSRTFGDNAARQRMNSDTTLRGSTPPRCMCIITGESTPDIGTSGVARFYVINVEGNDVKKDEALTVAQDCARRGYLQMAMRGYIEWLLPQRDAIPDELKTAFEGYRARAQGDVAGKAHSRAPETIASLMLGYDYFLRYAVSEGLGSSEWAAGELDAAWEVITANTVKQAEEAQEERPSAVFVNVLGELLTAHALAVRDMDDRMVNVDPTHGMIGYKDSMYYYLLPDVCYREVAKHIREKGQELSLPQRSLYRQMRHDKIITPPSTCETYTTSKRVPVDGGSAVKRLLWIPINKIDGGDAVEEQLTIQGAQIVPNEGLPF